MRNLRLCKSIFNFKRYFKKTHSRRKIMAKSDVVQAQLAAIQQAQIDAIVAGLGAAYDAGMADVAPAQPGFTQADLDKAVADAKAADAQVLADAQAKAVADMAALQGQFDSLSSKEAGENKIIVGLQGSIATLQSSLQALAALIPAPAPAPEVPPAQ
jgi:hypothetical protein